MIEQINRDNAIDKGKEGLQKANEWWDKIQKSNATTILGVSSIFGLVFISRISLLFIVAALGVQRILYHGKFFTDEDIKSKW